MSEIDDLERLHALHVSGALTEAEYADRKARSLAADGAPTAAGTKPRRRRYWPYLALLAAFVVIISALLASGTIAIEKTEAAALQTTAQEHSTTAPLGAKRTAVSSRVTTASDAQSSEPPSTVPIFCVDDKHRYQPVQRTNYGRLKQAFQAQLGFGSRLRQTSATVGSLTFFGPGKTPENIMYVVEPHDSGDGAGIALLAMRVRLHGATENLLGDEMCWRTFAILEAR